MALSMDQLNSVTKKHYIPILVDNIFKGNILTYKMLRNSKPVSGGYNIVVPIEYDKVDDDSVSPTSASTADFYADADTLNYGPKDFITAAQYDWVQAYATIRMTGLEEHTNEGPEKVIDLLEAKLKNAERSLKDVFATNIYSNNVDTSSSQKAMAGLGVICGSTATATGTEWDGSTATSTTLGGISPADAAAWVGGGITALLDQDASPAAGQVDYADLVDSADGNYIQTLLRRKYGELTVGSDSPTLIICSQVVFDAYEESLTAQKRFGASSSTLADAGFQNLLYRGTPVVVDQALEANAADKMFFINERGMGFKHHRKRNFVWEDFIKPVDKDFMVGRIFWMGNLCVSHRRVQGAYRGLPDSYTAS